MTYRVAVLSSPAVKVLTFHPYSGAITSRYSGFSWGILRGPTTELLPSTSVVFLFSIFTGYRYLSVTFYLAWPTPSGPSHCIHHPSSSTQLSQSSVHLIVREREGEKKSLPPLPTKTTYLGIYLKHTSRTSTNLFTLLSLSIPFIHNTQFSQIHVKRW